MGRLVEAIKEQEKALRRLAEREGKWSWPEFPRRFYRPGTVSSQMPGDDAWGRRPSAISKNDS